MLTATRQREKAKRICRAVNQHSLYTDHPVFHRIAFRIPDSLFLPSPVIDLNLFQRVKTGAAAALTQLKMV